MCRGDKRKGNNHEACHTVSTSRKEQEMSFGRPRLADLQTTDPTPLKRFLLVQGEDSFHYTHLDLKIELIVVFR